MADKVYQIENWVFIGNAPAKGGKRGHKFRQVYDGKLTDENLFFMCGAKSYTVGGQYEIEVWRGEGDQVSAKFGTMNFVGMIDDEELRSQWRANQAVYEMRARDAKMEKRFADEGTIPTDLNEIAQAWVMMNWGDRDAYERAILLEVRRLGGKILRK